MPKEYVKGVLNPQLKKVARKPVESQPALWGQTFPPTLKMKKTVKDLYPKKKAENKLRPEQKKVVRKK